MIRVFPRRTKMTPDDFLAFVGDPPMGILERLGRDHVVSVSCTFTWDRPEAGKWRAPRAYKMEMEGDRNDQEKAGNN